MMEKDNADIKSDNNKKDRDTGEGAYNSILKVDEENKILLRNTM